MSAFHPFRTLPWARQLIPLGGLRRPESGHCSRRKRGAATGHEQLRLEPAGAAQPNARTSSSVTTQRFVTFPHVQACAANRAQQRSRRRDQISNDARASIDPSARPTRSPPSCTTDLQHGASCTKPRYAFPCPSLPRGRKAALKESPEYVRCHPSQWGSPPAAPGNLEPPQRSRQGMADCPGMFRPFHARRCPIGECEAPRRTRRGHPHHTP